MDGCSKPKRLALLCGSLALATVTLLSSGCVRTVRTRYYLLSATAAETSVTLPTGTKLFLRHCKLPDYLQRSEMVVRKHPHEVTFMEFDVWAQRLEKMVAQVLRENLQLMTEIEHVAGGGQVMPMKNDWVLDYDFLQLEANRLGQLVTVVDCKLLAPGTTEAKTWRLDFTVPLMRKQGASITAAINQALTQIAAETLARMQ